jgi:hypothetical protein
MCTDTILDIAQSGVCGGFPLSNVNLVLWAVTCSGKLSLVVEYEEGTVDTGTMIQIKDKATGFLLQGDS